MTDATLNDVQQVFYNRKKKSPLTAFLLSIIPGLGMLYAGRVLIGIVGFIFPFGCVYVFGNIGVPEDVTAWCVLGYYICQFFFAVHEVQIYNMDLKIVLMKSGPELAKYL